MTDRPKILDLCAGGGGVSMGLFLAGFDVVAIDHQPQPRHPGNDLLYWEHMQFIQADALEFLATADLSQFCAVHGSPPCQDFSILRNLYTKETRAKHRELNILEPLRELLIASGLPYIIEGVPGTPLLDPFLLCGSMFGLQTKCGAQLRRHRLFETNWFRGEAPTCRHGRETVTVTGHSPMDGKKTILVHGDHPRRGDAVSQRKVIGIYGDHDRDRGDEQRTIGVYGSGNPVSGGRTLTLSVMGHSPEVKTTPARSRAISVTGSTAQQNVQRNRVREVFPVSAARDAMGIQWLGMAGLSQAIPPAYSKWYGERLLEYLNLI